MSAICWYSGVVLPDANGLAWWDMGLIGVIDPDNLAESGRFVARERAEVGRPDNGRSRRPNAGRADEGLDFVKIGRFPKWPGLFRFCASGGTSSSKENPSSSERSTTGLKLETIVAGNTCGFASLRRSSHFSH